MVVFIQTLDGFRQTMIKTVAPLAPFQQNIAHISSRCLEIPSGTSSTVEMDIDSK